MTTYAKIFERNHYQLPDLVRKSQAWFLQQATLIKSQGRIRPYYLMRGDKASLRPAIVPGEMYMFYYDAKLKDTLPYWDMFPLIFPFKKLSDGMLGLNMHYLPYHMRIKLLDRLMVYRNNTLMDETTRLRFSWATIEGVSKLNIAKPCVHRYLADHVKSPFRKVEPNDWATALMLPVERFVGANKQQVWTESLRK